jgi:outer membrane protein, heavy metal efflux system
MTCQGLLTAIATSSWSRRPLRAARLSVVPVLILLGALPAAAGDSPATIETLLAAAMRDNPGVKRLAAQADMLEHRMTQARSWESPMLGLSLRNLPVDSWRLDRDAMSMVEIELKQTLTFPGKNSRREAVARDEAAAAGLDLQEARTALAGAMRQTFLELTFVRQNDALTRDHVSLIAQAQDAARVRYENGRAEQADLWRLEVQRGVLEDELQELKRQETVLMAALNATAHRALDAAIATPETLEPTSAPPSLPELMVAAVQNRPAVAAVASRREAGLSAADLASYEAWPDLSLFAAYGVRQRVPGMSSGVDMVSAGLSLMLPVFYGSSFGAESAAMVHRAEMAAAEEDEVLTDLRRDLQEGLAQWRRSQSQVTTYADRLQPAARRTVDAVLSSYRANEAGFTELYEAEVMLLDVERTLARARIDTHRSQVRIEAAVGQSLP